MIANPSEIHENYDPHADTTSHADYRELEPPAREKLAELRRLAGQATPGPWKLWGMQVLADPVGDSNVDTSLPIAWTTDPHRGLRTFNASLIAKSRTAIPQLVDAISEVLDLHAESTHRPGTCSECYDVEYPEAYPCDTVRAIEEALR